MGGRSKWVEEQNGRRERSGMGGRSKWVEEQNGEHERRWTSDEDVGDVILVDDLVSVRCWGIQTFQNGKNRP